MPVWSISANRNFVFRLAHHSVLEQFIVEVFIDRRLIFNELVDIDKLSATKRKSNRFKMLDNSVSVILRRFK